MNQEITDFYKHRKYPQNIKSIADVAELDPSKIIERLKDLYSNPKPVLDKSLDCLFSRCNDALIQRSLSVALHDLVLSPPNNLSKRIFEAST